MTKHSDNQPSHFSWQTIMASAIITETYSQIMTVCINRRINVLLEKKTRKQGQAASNTRGFSQFAAQEIRCERLNFYLVSSITLNKCTTQKITLKSWSQHKHTCRSQPNCQNSTSFKMYNRVLTGIPLISCVFFLTSHSHHISPIHWSDFLPVMESKPVDVRL